MWRRFWSIKSLVILVVIGAVLFGAARLLNRPSSPTFVPVSNTELHRAWIEDVQTILVRYDQQKNAIEARDALLALKVAGEDRQIHLDLVLALSSGMDSASEKSRFQKTRKAFDALRGTSLNTSSTTPR